MYPLCSTEIISLELFLQSRVKVDVFIPEAPQAFSRTIYRDVRNERYLLPACQPVHGTAPSFAASASRCDSCLLSSGFGKKQRQLESQSDSDKLKCKSEASECLLPTSPSARGAEWLVPLEMLVHPVKCFISKSNRGKRAARSLSWKENENTGASSSNTSIMRRCTNIAPTACWPELTLLIGEKIIFPWG